MSCRWEPFKTWLQENWIIGTDPATTEGSLHQFVSVMMNHSLLSVLTSTWMGCCISIKAAAG